MSLPVRGACSKSVGIHPGQPQKKSHWFLLKLIRLGAGSDEVAPCQRRDQSCRSAQGDVPRSAPSAVT